MSLYDQLELALASEGWEPTNETLSQIIDRDLSQRSTLTAGARSVFHGSLRSAGRAATGSLLTARRGQREAHPVGNTGITSDNELLFP